MALDENIQWQAVRHCTDYGDYELVVEQQKCQWQCEQKTGAWLWRINYHGAITGQGLAADCETA